MSIHQLSDLVKDWGGFETLVAELHKTGDVTVEHNVVLTGRSGAGRQIDVVIRHRQGLYEHLVIVECKYLNRRVERQQVDALAVTVREVGASRGVIFSTEGFQSGAITQAEHESIDLFTIREPTDEEWGAPGRHIEFFLHIISIAPGNTQIQDPYILPFALPSSTVLNLRLGEGDQGSSTAIHAEGRPEKTLEALLDRVARDAAAKAYQPALLRFEGTDEGEGRFRVPVNFVPLKAIQVFAHGGIIFIPRITFDIGVRISQTHFQHDRGKNYAFVLAVEDCVRRSVTAASRVEGEQKTVLSPLGQKPDPNFGPILQNGSILQVWLKQLFSFDDFVDIVPERPLLVPVTKATTS